MAPDGQNFRAVNAIKLLENKKDITLDELIALGYDHYLAAFDVLLPPLFAAFNSAPDSLKKLYALPVQKLQEWDKRTDANSIATTIAIEWGSLMFQALPPAKTSEEGTYQTERVINMLKSMSNNRLLDIFTIAINNLTKKYGTWEIKWGEINRYQRPGDGVSFNDSAPSVPVSLTSSAFGQLPSFQSKLMNTKNRYGYSGNSFIAAVEFGPRIKAKSIITGGQSFDPSSKHFTDQAAGYIDGKFKDVLFYKEDVLGHAEKTYHPGD